MSTLIPIPRFWEPLLKKYVKKTFYADTRKKDFAAREDFTEGDYRFFSKGVADLNLAFTRERHSFPKNYFNRKEFRSGYILYFIPANAIKVASLLAEHSRENFLEENFLVEVGLTARVLVPQDEFLFVPRGGLEPPRIAPYAPQTYVSTSSTTWAFSKTKHPSFKEHFICDT